MGGNAFSIQKCLHDLQSNLCTVSVAKRPAGRYQSAYVDHITLDVDVAPATSVEDLEAAKLRVAILCPFTPLHSYIPLLCMGQTYM